MNILITAPSLDTTKNVSGISTVVSNIIDNCNHNFIHYQVGSEDNSKKGFSWITQLLMGYIKFPSALRKNQVDIIHQNIPLDTKGILREVMFNVLGRLCGRKIVTHIHGGKLLTEKPSKLVSETAKYILLHSDEVIVLSDIEKEELRTKFNYNNAHVLYNSVDIPDLQNREETKKDVYNILYIGRFHEDKGLKEVVTAFRKLEKELPFRFTLCGTGDLLDWMTKECSELLGDNFDYRGIVMGAEKSKAYAEADIFILASHYEGLPMSLLEAMSNGLVPIVTSVGSIPKIVRNNENGIIINKSDPDDIYKKLKLLLSSPETIDRLSKNARKTIVDSYNIKGYITKLNKIYSDCLKS